MNTRKLNRQVKRGCRKDKNIFLSNLCDDLEEQTKRSNSKGLFQTVKTLKGSYNKEMGNIKSEDGTVLTESEQTTTKDGLNEPKNSAKLIHQLKSWILTLGVNKNRNP